MSAGSIRKAAVDGIPFNVAADAADQTVPINPQAWIDEKQVMPDSPLAQIEPGHVRISQTPVFLSCFFFTH